MCPFNSILMLFNLLPGGDTLSRWWGAVIGVAAHWLNGDDDQAAAFYPIIDAFPKQLTNSDDPLPQAVFLAFR